MHPRLFLAVVLAVFLAPAAEGLSVVAPLDVRLETPVPPQVDGDFEAWTRATGVLDLAPCVADECPAISWAGGTVILHDRWHALDSGGDPGVAPEPTREPLGAGVLRGLRCGPGCQVFALWNESDATLTQLSARVNGSLPWLETGRSGKLGPGSLWVATVHETPDATVFAGMLAFTTRGPDGGLVLEAPWLRIDAPLRLLTWNATLLLDTADGPVEATSGFFEPDSALPASAGRWSRIVEIELSEGVLEADGGSWDLVLERTDVRFNGTIDLGRATGVLRTVNHTHHVEAEDVTTVGEFNLTLVHDWMTPFRPDQVGAVILERGGLYVVGTGDATQVHAGDRLVLADTPRLPAYAAPAAVSALMLLAFALRGVVPLYSRMARDDAYKHPSRRRILELLEREGSLRPADIARALGLHRVLVQYHLRVLVQHRLVHATGSARSLYYQCLADDGGHARVRALLRTPARAGIASCLARAPEARSQADIVQETGLRQTLVSYHLRRLESGGLIARTPGHPQRYSPTPALLAWLEREDARAPREARRGEPSEA